MCFSWSIRITAGSRYCAMLRVVTLIVQPLVRPVAVLLHQLARLGAARFDIGTVSRQRLQDFRRQAPQALPAATASRRRSGPGPSETMSMNALRSIVSIIALRRSGSLNGGLSRFTMKVERDHRRVEFADRGRRLALDVLHRLHGLFVREGHVELAGDKGERLRRAVRDDRPLDRVEIGQALASSNPCSCQLDVLVALELDELEWSGADRLAPHLGRRHMAGIDDAVGRRPAAS